VRESALVREFAEAFSSPDACAERM
jgi:hypothetical protein